MINNRLSGLLNLHAAVTVLMSSSLLLVYSGNFHYLYPVALSPTVDIMQYLYCVIAGVLISTKHLQSVATRFHRLTWVDSAWLATRQTVVVSLLIFALMFAFKKEDMSRVFVGTFLGLLWTMLLFVNLGLPKFLCRLFFENSRRVPTLFIGSQKSQEKLKNWLASKEMLGIQAVGFLSEQENIEPGCTPAFLGRLADLSRVITERRVVQVIVLELPRSNVESQFIIEVCQKLGCRILIYSNLSEQLRHPLITVTEEGHQFHALQAEPLEDPLNRVLKRMFDLTISTTVVVFIMPPLIAWVWIMQYLQARGPVFFTQERTGHGQNSFRILKFRSMFAARQTAESEAKQVRRGDDRIYPFGRFLRTSSLDEFPQFINVMKGEMSIVGPRPHLVAHDHQFSRTMKGYRTRFFVKPGITGLAQSRGFRGEIIDPQLLESRIRLDVDYISQWSIWLDIQIIIKTAWQLFFPPKTAY